MRVLDHRKKSLPLFALWGINLLNDEVYISDGLRDFLKKSSNIITNKSFLSETKKLLGNFLDKSSVDITNRGEYQKIIGDYNIVFRYDKSTGVFTLYMIKLYNHPDILDDLPIYVWERDDNLKIKYCNKKYADALNTDVKDVIDKNINLLSTDLNYYEQQSLERIAITTGKPQKKKKHIIIEGERKLLEFTETGKSLGFAIDLSEEEKILKEYEIYKKQTIDTFNYISSSIAIFDMNMKLVFVNDAMIRLFCISESYMAHDHYMSDILDFLIEQQKIMPTNNYPEFKKKVSGYFREIVSPYHTFMHTPDGRSLNIVISPNYDGELVFIFDDITEKISLEREYESLTAIQRETFEHLHEAILVFGADNRLRMINISIKKMWNKANEKTYKNVHIKDFFTESVFLFPNKDDCESWISHAINLGEKREEFFGVFDFKDRHIDYAYVPLPDGLNLIRFIDITDRVILERTLLEKAKILTETDRLKSGFITNISCELNAPINTIAGFIDILVNQYFGEINEKQMEYCLATKQAIKKLSETIEAMLNLATMEAGQMKIQYKEVSVFKLFNESISLFTETAKNKNITINHYLTDEKLNIFIDERSIKQVIFQIINKFLKITPANGEIVILCNFLEEFSDYIDISVQTTKTEILPDEFEKIENILHGRGKKEDRDAFSSTDFGIMYSNNVIIMHNGKMYVSYFNGKDGIEIGFRIPSKPFFISNSRKNMDFIQIGEGRLGSSETLTLRHTRINRQ
ncbi:MAG: PAS-domain containing protein [Holosporales bacterium]|jgi:PAS domain-containing protein|nr:PAS-domain containing protein [Holosporales bacterium]